MGQNRIQFLTMLSNDAIFSFKLEMAGSLSDLKNRSEKVTGRGQILTILKANSRSIGRKSGEIWTGPILSQPWLLQPISFKSDRLLDKMTPIKANVPPYERLSRI